MLNQLVESKESHNGLKNTLLLITLAVVAVAFMLGLTYSLFAQQLAVGGDGLELSTLVAPPIPDEAPPPPEPEENQPKKQDTGPKIATRTEAIARIDMSPTEPPKISTEKFKGRSIPDAPFKIGKTNTDVPPGTRTGPVRAESTGGGFGDAVTEVKPTPAPTEKPVAAPPPKPPKPPVPKRISKGVVNGQAVSLPKPAYPAAARAVNAKGSVSVAIVISKSGSVMSARAVSGHPLLRRAAQSAARRARFRPTLLSGQPVEVSGVIVYNFN